MKLQPPKENKFSSEGPDGSEERRIRYIKEFFIYSICLLISFFFWFIQVNQQDDIEEIYIPIRYDDLPKNLIPKEIQSKPKYIRVELQGKGISLLKWRLYKALSSRKDSLAVSTYTDAEGLYYKASNHYIHKKLDSLLHSEDVTIRSFFPNQISVTLVEQKKKTIPIEFYGKLSPASGYVLLGYKILPSSMDIYGSYEALSKIKSVKTKMVYKRELTDKGKFLTTSLLLPKSVHSHIREVKILPHIELLRRIRLEQVDIQPYGFEEGAQIHLLPSQVSVELDIPESKLNEAKNIKLDLYVDAQERLEGYSELTIKLRNKPKWIINYNIVPKKVEYIIDK